MELKADKLCLKKVSELTVLQKDERDGVIVTILTSVAHLKKNIDYHRTMEKIPVFKKSLRSKLFLNPTLPTKENITGSSNSWTTNVHCHGLKLETPTVFTICEGERGL